MSANIVRHLLVRGERSFLQDPGFGIRQLVDIAIRALSPAVNDPTTAVQALDRLNDLLVVAAVRPPPTGLRIDAHHVPRLQLRVADFEQLLTLAVTEIIRYGADAPQVVRRLSALLDELEGHLRGAGTRQHRRQSPAPRQSGRRRPSGCLHHRCAHARPAGLRLSSYGCRRSAPTQTVPGARLRRRPAQAGWSSPGRQVWSNDARRGP